MENEHLLITVLASISAVLGLLSLALSMSINNVVDAINKQTDLMEQQPELMDCYELHDYCYYQWDKDNEEYKIIWFNNKD